MSRYPHPMYGPGTFVELVWQYDLPADDATISRLNARLARLGKPLIDHPTCKWQAAGLAAALDKCEAKKSYPIGREHAWAARGAS